MKTVDFSEKIAACHLKVGGCRQLIEIMKVRVISLPYIFHVLYVLCLTRPTYQVSVYRTIGPQDFFLFSLKSLSRLFHSYRDEPIGRWGETGVL